MPFQFPELKRFSPWVAIPAAWRTPVHGGARIRLRTVHPQTAGLILPMSRAGSVRIGSRNPRGCRFTYLLDANSNPLRLKRSR
ncbi:hypothetical protein Xaut_1333 [Xanthobacter versatilis]|uniref:Uncharacterized protein n=1 Tax=Xanthobacter autotrophicus (strain ATCC BAA-1158 / Py2) TaxID=78245 RepID=A7IEY9_XANP2|nr:hypothetical protein Xaut_1333 [Xanthobacter autotrophicus Py2]